mgnify:FL=1
MSSRKKGAIIVIAFVTYAFPWLCSAMEKAGEYTIGKTYPVVESDIYDELMAKVRSYDWSKVFDKDRFVEKVKKWKPSVISLSRAPENRTFTVDLTWTLPYDIKDIDGKVIYPKGYIFNPLDYVVMPTQLVIINGEDEDQVKWFKSSPYGKAPAVMLLITDGSWFELSSKLKRAVYWAVPQIIEGFRIKHLPSVVYQKGNRMVVEEVKIDEKE